MQVSCKVKARRPKVHKSKKPEVGGSILCYGCMLPPSPTPKQYTVIRLKPKTEQGPATGARMWCTRHTLTHRRAPQLGCPTSCERRETYTRNRCIFSRGRHTSVSQFFSTKTVHSDKA